MKRPLPLDPSYIAAQTSTMSAREFGILMRLALHFWATGSLPEDRALLARAARVGPDAIEAALPIVMPFFEPGALFPILREAAAAKYDRRSKAGRLGGLRRVAVQSNREGRA